MDWIWLGGLSIILNIVSIVILFQCKKLNNLDETQRIDDVQAIEQSIDAFVTKMERENDVLYQKLVHYIKEKENSVTERIRILEEKIEAEGTSTPLIEHSSDDHEEVEQTGDEEQHSGEKEQSGEKDQSSEKVLEEEKISQLYKQGFSPKQIAKVLQMDYGKVELIINMFKKRQGYLK